MKIKIESKPLSVNQAWQGRRYKTPRYNKWRQDVEYLLPKEQTIKGNVVVDIAFHIRAYSTTDIDNLAKPLIDSLVNKQYIEDDRYIKKLILEKYKSKEQFIEIEIKSYEQKL